MDRSPSLCTGPDRSEEVQDADAGAPIQRLPALAAAAGDPVDIGAEEDWKEEGPLQNPGLVRG